MNTENRKKEIGNGNSVGARVIQGITEEYKPN